MGRQIGGGGGGWLVTVIMQMVTLMPQGRLILAAKHCREEFELNAQLVPLLIPDRVQQQHISRKMPRVASCTLNPHESPITPPRQYPTITRLQ